MRPGLAPATRLALGLVVVGLLAALGCARDTVRVPLQIEVPSDAATSLTLEVVVTSDGMCADERPVARGNVFLEGDTTPLELERGSVALWVGAWSGTTCGEASCYVGCSTAEVRPNASLSVMLRGTDCSNVCVSGSDAGTEDGGLDAASDAGSDARVDVEDGGPPAECTTGYVEVAAGFDHTCALHANGDVYCWGANDHGQCGAPVSATVAPTRVALSGRAVQIGAGEEFSCARLEGGTVACWGNDGGNQDRNGSGGSGPSTPEPSMVMGVAGASDLAVGFWHSCALVTGNRVRCWGQNASGELGAGETCSAGTCPQISGSHEVADVVATAVAAGVGSSCALLSSSGVLCWGYNEDLQLSVPTGATAVTSPRQVEFADRTDLTGVIGIAGGGTRSFEGANFRATTCGFHTNGVTCWGANDQGQAAPSAVLVVPTTWSPTPSGVHELSVGATHACAIHGEERTLSCWGSNANEQLGTSGAGRRGPTNLAIVLPHGACSVAASERHTCAALTDGSVHCWGSDEAGRLGGDGGTATPRPVMLPLR